ncbi:MAG: hypothetical protein F4Z85_03195 [Gemmatimonadetes bacterium]|nr:hypothetical protein [Gemmatimonadota bacterium]
MHASAPNLSLQPRWSLIYAYVAAANTYVLSDWPADQCPLIEKWDDSEVAAATQRHWETVTAVKGE